MPPSNLCFSQCQEGALEAEADLKKSRRGKQRERENRQSAPLHGGSAGIEAILGLDVASQNVQTQKP